MFDPIQPPTARRPQEVLDLVSQALSDGDLEAALAQYGSTALLRQQDGTWRIAADAWQVTAELPPDRWLSCLPDASTTARSE